MNQRNKKLLLAAGLLAVCGVPAALAVHFFRLLPGEPLAVGGEVPEFEVLPVGGAQAAPRGGRRVLLFFSPSCPHCDPVLAQWGQLRERHPEWFAGDDALSLTLISVTGKEATAAFAAVSPWPVYYDPGRRAIKAVRGVSVPYVVLIDEQGRVRYRRHGPRSLAQDEALLESFYETGRAP